MHREVHAAHAGLEAALTALEAALTALIQVAPAGAPHQVRCAAANALALALEAAAAGRREHVALACAIERCLELLAEGLVDPGVALPALAMSTHTARSSDSAAVKAACYEVETLLPLPGAPLLRRALDVPAASLVRAPRGVRDERATPTLVIAASWPAAVVEQVEAARRRLRIT